MYSYGHPYIEENLFNSGGNKNWALTIGEKFGVDKTGAIYATGGVFAGWTVDGNLLSSGNTGIYSGDEYKVASSFIEDSFSSVRFYCGSTNPTEARFKVLDDGSLYASAAEIEGTITATGGKINGSLTIGSNGYLGIQNTYSSSGSSNKGTYITNELIDTKTAIFGNAFVGPFDYLWNYKDESYRIDKLNLGDLRLHWTIYNAYPLEYRNEIVAFSKYGIHRITIPMNGDPYVFDVPWNDFFSKFA